MTILADVKASLRITHTDDDVLLTRLIAAASDACAMHLYGEIPDYEATGAPVDPQTVKVCVEGIILWVEGSYDGDPLQRDKYQMAAQGMWNTYRSTWGV